MTVNQATIDLIKQFEGFREDAYQDSANVWTIGWGTTSRANVGVKPVKGMTITKDAAEVYLRRAVNDFAEKIRPHITAPVNENEFGAFVSLAYNIGPGAFIESTALRRFNDGDKAGCAEAMLWWNKAGGRVLRGLSRRREAEVALFKTPVSPPPVEVQPQGWLAGLVAFILGLLRR